MSAHLGCHVVPTYRTLSRAQVASSAGNPVNRVCAINHLTEVNAPWNRRFSHDTLIGMNPLVIIIVLLLLFGGGGFYFGGPTYGGGGFGLVLLICLIVYLFGGFRSRN